MKGGLEQIKLIGLTYPIPALPLRKFLAKRQPSPVDVFLESRIIMSGLFPVLAHLAQNRIQLNATITGKLLL